MMHDQGTGWMWGLGLGHGLYWIVWILLLILLIGGLAALIKYLSGGK